MKQERGSLSVLLAGYLALAVLLGVSMAAVGISLVAKNRIQAVADSAVLYAHDRAARKGIPDQVKLQDAVVKFLALAPSAKQLQVVRVEGCQERSLPSSWLGYRLRSTACLQGTEQLAQERWSLPHRR